ncbi:DUF6152 family protein [Noviherbaspirillum aridicola]|uniref:Uncharacterized protein n=1 Tax=Noviherbaspirillum aridicola TaxID=2849687 RepID=A0ABQ4Q0C4_9BURK|nr:DUF6152 family protein [Noviherbaspirillum aridicola]GIZ50230.1 hypothetical protein NCCP691_02440 [Noviherbaspirillum aridicola]
MKRYSLLMLFAAGAVYAHHGWGEYDADKAMELKGQILESGYVHPHGFVKLKSGDQTWHVVLAPPSRMENRGLARDMLQAGGQATVYGYPNRNKPDEMRAERITVGGKTTELR